jgi:Uncharacterized protein conserved in bacteria (DUF2242)
MDLRQDVRRHPARAGPVAALCAVAAIAGCALPPGVGRSSPSVYQQERFQADETFSRLFDANVQDTCEAARRALLSQGYVITAARSDAITGVKRFQPEGEVHVEISFHVVCVPSVPLSSSEDSLVKVGSETIPAGQFYDRYFALVKRLLDEMR